MIVLKIIGGIVICVAIVSILIVMLGCIAAFIQEKDRNNEDIY